MNDYCVMRADNHVYICWKTQCRLSNTITFFPHCQGRVSITRTWEHNMQPNLWPLNPRQGVYSRRQNFSISKELKERAILRLMRCQAQAVNTRHEVLASFSSSSRGVEGMVVIVGLLHPIIKKQFSFILWPFLFAD